MPIPWPCPQVAGHQVRPLLIWQVTVCIVLVSICVRCEAFFKRRCPQSLGLVHAASRHLSSLLIPVFIVLLTLDFRPSRLRCLRLVVVVPRVVARVVWVPPCVLGHQVKCFSVLSDAHTPMLECCMERKRGRAADRYQPNNEPKQGCRVPHVCLRWLSSCGKLLRALARCSSIPTRGMSATSGTHADQLAQRANSSSSSLTCLIIKSSLDKVGPSEVALSPLCKRPRSWCNWQTHFVLEWKAFYFPPVDRQELTSTDLLQLPMLVSTLTPTPQCTNTISTQLHRANVLAGRLCSTQDHEVKTRELEVKQAKGNQTAPRFGHVDKEQQCKSLLPFTSFLACADDGAECNFIAKCFAASHAQCHACLAPLS